MSTANNVIAALASYKIKSIGANKYRSQSPYRADSDSLSFALDIDDDEHGKWFDHVAENGGSLYELAAHLGIETPKNNAQQTKRHYDHRADYAKAHGIPDSALAAASWQPVQYQNRPALEYPTKSGKRWRFLDGEQPHYKSQQGYKPCWYGLNQMLLGRLAYGHPLVIANGEISTVAGQHYNMAVCCVTSGEKDIPDHLVKELKTFTQPIEDLEVIIALDCDDKGRKTALKIKETLSKAGFNSVRAVDMQLSKGGDVADFCMLHGELDDDGIIKVPPLPALQKCVDVKPPFVPIALQRWQIIHASELENLPPIDWLIAGEIPERSLTVMFGPSGTGKSFLAVDYALRIAQDNPVVYMAGEGQAGYRGRVKAWCKHHTATVGQLFMCLGAVSFMDESDLTNFIQAIENTTSNPKLIVVDTLARSMLGADENSSRDMGKFVAACEQVQHYFDCTVMIVHHTNKGGVSERGSGALRGSADSMIKLVDEDDLIRVECAKSKDSKGFDTRYMSLLPVDIGMVDRDGNNIMPPVIVESKKVVQSETDSLTDTQNKVLETLDMPIYEFGASYSELTSSLPEINERTLQRVLSRLKTLAFIEQTARREPYKITNKGKLKISKLPDQADSPDTSHDTSNNGNSLVSNGVASVGNVGSDNVSEQQRLLDAPQKERYYAEGR